MAAALAVALALTTTYAQTAESPYKFEGGYPAAGTAERTYNASDLPRAVEAFKFTGVLKKVVIELGKSGLAANDEKELEEVNKKLAEVRD